MLWACIILALIFIAVGLLVTEKNAPQILAGFNTLSHKNQQKTDLKKLVKLFRKFHVFLGASLLL